MCCLYSIGKSSLEITSVKGKVLTLIALTHLLLWESSLVSLEPLEVGELHFRVRAGHFFKSDAPSLLLLSMGFPLFRVPSLVTGKPLVAPDSHFLSTGASSPNGGPLAPHSEKAPRAPFPFLTHSQETCWTPLTPGTCSPHAAGAWT